MLTAKKSFGHTTYVCEDLAERRLDRCEPFFRFVFLQRCYCRNLQLVFHVVFLRCGGEREQEGGWGDSRTGTLTGRCFSHSPLFHPIILPTHAFTRTSAIIVLYRGRTRFLHVASLSLMNRLKSVMLVLQTYSRTSLETSRLAFVRFFIATSHVKRDHSPEVSWME